MACCHRLRDDARAIVTVLPAGAIHTYLLLSPEARVLGVGTSDGRFLGLQREAGPLFADRHGPDMAKIGALASAAGVEIVGPPLVPSDGRTTPP